MQVLFLPYLRDLKLENMSIAAPDMGGAKGQMPTQEFWDAR